jgi:hypothetical protein
MMADGAVRLYLFSCKDREVFSRDLPICLLFIICLRLCPSTSFSWRALEFENFLCHIWSLYISISWVYTSLGLRRFKYEDDRIDRLRGLYSVAR